MAFELSGVEGVESLPRHDSLGCIVFMFPMRGGDLDGLECSVSQPLQPSPGLPYSPCIGVKAQAVIMGQ